MHQEQRSVSEFLSASAGASALARPEFVAQAVEALVSAEVAVFVGAVQDEDSAAVHGEHAVGVAEQEPVEEGPK